MGVDLFGAQLGRRGGDGQGHRPRSRSVIETFQLALVTVEVCIKGQKKLKFFPKKPSTADCTVPNVSKSLKKHLWTCLSGRLPHHSKSGGRSNSRKRRTPSHSVLFVGSGKSRAMILRIVFVALIATVSIPPHAFAQDLPQRGVIVESMLAGFEASKAGLRPGDIIQTWTRGDTKGTIKSPFDLSLVEAEEAPRGEVLLEGLRNNARRVWRMGRGRW